MHSSFTVSLRRRRHPSDAIHAIHGMVASLQRYRRPPLSSVRVVAPLPALAVFPEHFPDHFPEHFPEHFPLPHRSAFRAR